MLDGGKRAVATSAQVEDEGFGICVVFDDHRQVDIAGEAHFATDGDSEPADEGERAPFAPGAWRRHPRGRARGWSAQS